MSFFVKIKKLCFIQDYDPSFLSMLRIREIIYDFLGSVIYMVRYIIRWDNFVYLLYILQKWNLVRSPVTGHPVYAICTASSHETLLRILSFRLVSGHDLLLRLSFAYILSPRSTAKINKKLNIFRTMTIFFRARKGKRAFSPSGRFPALKFRFWWGHVELCKERALFSSWRKLLALP